MGSQAREEQTGYFGAVLNQNPGAEPAGSPGVSQQLDLKSLQRHVMTTAGLPVNDLGGTLVRIPACGYGTGGGVAR
jgi:hypothetical protein